MISHQNAPATTRSFGADLMSEGRSLTTTDIVICLLTVALGASYIGHFAWRNWLPWDDGILAQAAERVLRGQLPHRDFNEPYTGGLTWLHAAAFRVLGISLRSLRTTLFAFAVASIPVWYYVARRFAPPLVAAVVTLTCIAWSVPNYAASLPSWYNLFFAMVALAALLRYVEKRSLRWVFVGGLCIGLSIVIKIIGLYLAAGIVVFLAYNSSFDDAALEARRHPQRPAIAVVLLIVVTFAVAPLLLTLVGGDSNSLNPVIALGLPPSLVACAVGAAIVLRLRSGWRPTPRILWELLLLASGVAVVLVLFTIPYLDANATGALLRGVFLRAQYRFQLHGSRATGPDLLWMCFSLPLAYAIASRERVTRARSSAVWTLVLFCILADLAAFSLLPALFIWLSVRMLMLPLAVAVAWHVWRRSNSGGAPPIASRQLVLLTCIAAWCSVVQFPYSRPIYFAYAAPLVILTAVALAEANRRPAPVVRLVVLAGYCLFALILRPRLYPQHAVREAMSAFNLSRGGILVPVSDKQRYEELTALLTKHARTNFTLALPDLPEVYFLSGLENPTRSFFQSYDYPPSSPMDVLKQIRDHRITAIVINHSPHCSSPLTRALEDSLVGRFPEAKRFGSLEVRWQQ